MAQFHSIQGRSDRVMERLVAGLEIEFGRGAGEGLAARFLAAEESDFLWEARICERWLGAYLSEDEAQFELDRVAIFGRIDGKWFAAISIVDGEGQAHGLIGRRKFSTAKAARNAYATAR